jgi:hypothetical protein
VCAKADPKPRPHTTKIQPVLYSPLESVDAWIGSLSNKTIMMQQHALAERMMISDMYPFTGEDKIFCKFGYQIVAAHAS